MCRAGVEPAQLESARVTASEARQCPADTISPMAQEGVEPSAFPLLKGDGLPIAYRAELLRGVGVEPTSSRSKRDSLPLADPRARHSLPTKKGQVSGRDTWPLQMARKRIGVTSANDQAADNSAVDRQGGRENDVRQVESTYWTFKHFLLLAERAARFAPSTQ